MDQMQASQFLKSAIVSGASRGIGSAIAKAFVARGCQVHALSRRTNPRLDHELVRWHSIDLRELNQIENLHKRIEDNVDTLVLNAGIGRFGGLEQFSTTQIRELVDLNLTSNLLLVKEFLPMFKRQGGGDIVIIGSESGIQGGKSGSVYCATKFALRGFAQSLRADCSNANIRVVLVSPGPVDSNFFDELNFQPIQQQEFYLNPSDVATSVLSALQQPRHVVLEEVRIQPMKRSFVKK